MTRVGVVVRAAAGVWAATFLLVLLGSAISLIKNEHASFAREATESLVLLIAGPPVTVGFVGLYALPAILAYLRDHRNVIPLTIANAAIGWTMLGWIACLAWAFSSHVEEPREFIGKIVAHADGGVG